MPINSLQLTNVGPFRRRPDGSGSDGITMEFDANVNLFIGPNNVGKSTILDSLQGLVGSGEITGLFPAAHNAGPGGCSEIGKAPFRLEWVDIFGSRKVLSGDLHGACNYGRLAWALKTLDDPSAEREIRLKGEHWGWSEENNRDEDGYVGYYNPGVRGNSSYPMTQSMEQHTLSFMRSLRDPQGGYFDDQELFDKIDRVLSDVVAGFPIDLATKNYTDAGYGSYDFFSNTIDGDVVSENLSRGTRSVLDCIYYFVMDMAQFYVYIDSLGRDWANMPGIFIIDEIDAHLHPSWQRRIIPTLQRHFPNVQIFASTHSPMMVAGLKKGQVHLLKRDETGQVVWSRNEQDIIGWTADEIYRTLMGIDDPTDELTVQRANRLRELRDMEPRSEAEEDEMNALRRQVNQDLLAKGPVNPQNERYAELMHRFLVSLETELSQDGA